VPWDQRRFVVKYAMLLYAAPDARGKEGPAGPAGEGVFDNWVDYTRALKDAGVLVAAEQLQVVDTATTVRLRGGERLLTDGPFAETKEHLLGFYLIDVVDLDAALDWAARMPLIGFGTVEVRPSKVGMAWQALLE
jgi:hypothetical protein